MKRKFEVTDDPSNEFEVIHLLLFCSEVPVLVRYFALGLIKGESLEREKRSYHVFSDSLRIFSGFCPDLAMHVETCMVFSLFSAIEVITQFLGKDLSWLD